MNMQAEWSPSQPFLDAPLAESRAGDASWGCESALPFFMSDEPAQALLADTPGAPPCPRADSI